MRLPIRTLAAGAINTSVADLANWMRLHLRKGEFDGECLLPAALIDALHAPRVYESQSEFAEFGAAHYGLGFQCQSYRGDRVVFHGGGWPGCGARMTLVPDFGIGVAVLTNRNPSELLGTLTWYIVTLRSDSGVGQATHRPPELHVPWSGVGQLSPSANGSPR